LSNFYIDQKITLLILKGFERFVSDFLGDVDGLDIFSCSDGFNTALLGSDDVTTPPTASICQGGSAMIHKGGRSHHQSRCTV